MWNHIRLGWLIAVTWCPALAAAQPPADIPATWRHCFREAGAYYRIAPELLISVAHIESSLDPGAQHFNSDGSWDLGLMQINTRWLPALKSMGLAPESLYDPCTSIWVGAWILASNIAQYGYGWSAVGAYNAGTADTPPAHQRREAYARKVARVLVRSEARSISENGPVASHADASSAVSTIVVKARTTGSRSSRAAHPESVQ